MGITVVQDIHMIGMDLNSSLLFDVLIEYF